MLDTNSPYKWGELVTGANWQWGELTVNQNGMINWVSRNTAPAARAPNTAISYTE